MIHLDLRPVQKCFPGHIITVESSPDREEKATPVSIDNRVSDHTEALTCQPTDSVPAGEGDHSDLCKGSLEDSLVPVDVIQSFRPPLAYDSFV